MVWVRGTPAPTSAAILRYKHIAVLTAFAHFMTANPEVVSVIVLPSVLTERLVHAALPPFIEMSFFGSLNPRPADSASSFLLVVSSLMIVYSSVIVFLP